MRAEPYLELSSGQSAHLYQLFVERDPEVTVPTVQVPQSAQLTELQLLWCAGAVRPKFPLQSCQVTSRPASAHPADAQVWSN